MSFEDWWYGQEGFGLRAERFFEEECERDMQLFIDMKKWLEAAYEAGQEKDADEWYEKTLWGDKPSKREWVGLNDSEINEIQMTSPHYVSHKAISVFLPMIEAKLKEKNT